MATDKTITQVLSEIQSKLRAPKSQFNSFGKYNYRNLEDILEALKPILSEYSAAINLIDDIVQVGERYYVKAVAILLWNGQTIDSTAYARESESKKGMDDAQVTGSTSSYARKYAMNGLFAIDDTKDSDTTNKGKEEAPDTAEKTTEYLADCDSKTTVEDIKKWWADNSNKIKKDLGQANASIVYKHMLENKKILEGMENAPAV